jgi:ABC-type multidrug transport system fused ATPase/permease subunit
MLLTLSWKLSLLALVLIPLDVLWLRWMRRKVERDVRQLRERSADMSSFMVETLPVMKFIQSAGQQQRESRRLETLGQGYMSQLLRLQITEFFTQAVPGTLTSLSRACAFLIGGGHLATGRVDRVFHLSGHGGRAGSEPARPLCRDSADDRQPWARDGIARRGADRSYAGHTAADADLRRLAI